MIDRSSTDIAVANWVAALGENFKPVAKEFLHNGVTGDDIFDDEVVSRDAFDDMLSGLSINKFAKNKLWKRIEQLKSNSDSHVRDLTESFPQMGLRAAATPFQPSFPLMEHSESLFSRNAIEPVKAPRKKSYAELALCRTPKKKSSSAKGGAGSSAAPRKKSPVKMVCWRALDKSQYTQEALETFLLSKFKVCFQYQAKSQKFSIYGQKEQVHLAVESLKEKKIDYDFLFQYTYEMDTFELHLSTRAVQTLLDHNDLQEFVKENEITLRCESMNKTKSNGEKQCKLLISGKKWPEAAMQIKDILGRDYSRVFTNYIYTTAHPKFDAIMHDRHDPFWKVIARDTETNVRTLTKTDYSGKRHVLISGKVTNVMRAKEMLELRLSFQQ